MGVHNPRRFDIMHPNLASMRRMIRELLAEFDPQYRLSNWIAIQETLCAVSRAMRRLQAIPPGFRSGDYFEAAHTNLRLYLMQLITWMFSIAVYWDLEIDRGWKTWNYKVKRKTYMDHPVPRPNPSPAPAGDDSRETGGVART